jgi:hypothetical protein
LFSTEAVPVTVRAVEAGVVAGATVAVVDGAGVVEFGFVEQPPNTNPLTKSAPENMTFRMFFSFFRSAPPAVPRMN